MILGKFGLGSQLSTGKLIAARLKEFPKRLGQFFREPKKLLPVLGMVALWLITYLLRAFGVNGIPTKILSFLTFAGSSSFSNPLSLLGGLVGKGIFAAAVTSIISLLANKKKTQAPQPKRSFGEMLKGAFGVSGDTIFGWLCGIGAALIAYCFISGGNGLMSVMGGAVAAFTAAGAAAGAVFGSSSGGNNLPTSSFAMCVNKNFENTIELGQTPVPVFAHIVEYPPGGGMRPRPDLTQSIRTFSGDGKLIVQDGGITNGYRKALVSASRAPRTSTTRA